MKRVIILLIFSSLFLNESFFAQSYEFNAYTTSRFARTIRLGNAYTGVAEGPETMYYNAAGLANESNYSAVFSSGQGIGLYIEDYDAYDLAVVAPLNSNIGTAGLSVNYLSMQFYPASSSETIYSLHFARNIFPGMSIGLSIHDYVSSITDSYSYEDEPPTSRSANAIDLSLSALFKFPIGLSEGDGLKLGFLFSNILDTKLTYNAFLYDNPKYQLLRSGISYKYIPMSDMDYQLLVSFDAVLNGTGYKFYEWQPNYGIELTLFEWLQLSYGRENEIQIKHTYNYSPQHPVNRYGFGINLPVSEIIKENIPLKISINYCYSNWQKIDESHTYSHYENKYFSMRTSSFSIGVNYKL